MHLFICLFIYFVCLFIENYIYIHVCLFIGMHIYTCVYMHIFIYFYIFTFAYNYLICKTGTPIVITIVIIIWIVCRLNKNSFDASLGLANQRVKYIIQIVPADKFLISV